MNDHKAKDIQFVITGFSYENLLRLDKAIQFFIMFSDLWFSKCIISE